MLKGQVLESHPDTPYSRLPSTESDRPGTHTSSWKAGGPQLRLTALPRGSLKPRAGGNLKETPEGAQWPRQDLWHLAVHREYPWERARPELQVHRRLCRHQEQAPKFLRAREGLAGVRPAACSFLPRCAAISPETAPVRVWTSLTWLWWND